MTQTTLLNWLRILISLCSTSDWEIPGVMRLKVIHINCDLPEALQRYTCAHELGHAVLHKGVPTPFLKRHTLFSVEKIERQANTFAVELLMPDNLLKEYEGYPIKDIAYMAGIPEGMEMLKIN